MSIRHGPFACLLAAVLTAGCSPTSGESMQPDQQAVDRPWPDPQVTAVDSGGAAPYETGDAAGTDAKTAHISVSRAARTPDKRVGQAPDDMASDDAAPPGGMDDDAAGTDRAGTDRPGSGATPNRPDTAFPASGDRTDPRPLDLPPSNAAAEDAPFPEEVTAFMVARDGCDHFRGEESQDAERRAFLESSIAKLCTGTDAKLAALRRRYGDDPAVVAALSAYDDRIEGIDTP